MYRYAIEIHKKYMQNAHDNYAEYKKIVEVVHGVNIERFLELNGEGKNCKCGNKIYYLKKHVCPNDAIQYKLECIGCYDRLTQYFPHEDVKNKELINYANPMNMSDSQKTLGLY